MGEGRAKEERDRIFEELKRSGKQGAKVPDKWADAEVQKIIYGFDAMEVAKEAASKAFAQQNEAKQGIKEGRRERRPSAMSVEEARDDTNATIKVMRMRDRGST